MPQQPQPMPDTPVALTDLGCIRVEGADALEFLQAQLASDVRALSPGSAGLSCYCNLKGRVSALFMLHRQQDGFIIVLPDELADPLAARLSKYILRAQVTLTRDEELRVWGTYAHPDDASVRHAFALPGAGDGRWIALSDKADPANPTGITEWLADDIRGGLPRISAGTADEFLPQMLDLDRLGAISYSKGCFPGQEIVARARRGIVKRRLYRARIEGDGTITPGQRVESEAGDLAGQILLSAADAAGEDCLALAVLRSESIDSPLLTCDRRLGDIERVRPD